jgi:NAD(P)-dependent dehydrogenase (short-subunit alcohol dehydrogenase family)
MVNLSSVAATLGSPHEYVHYAGAKGAVDGFSIGLAKELAAQGIRVNVVSPGPALTEIHAAAGEPEPPGARVVRIPMGRPATADEVAQAVLWLLSDAALYVTGTVLKVAGGL